MSINEYSMHKLLTIPSSVNSTKAKRRTELGSPQMRQSTTLGQVIISEHKPLLSNYKGNMRAK